MKEKGKVAAQTMFDDDNQDQDQYNYAASYSEFPCKKHPSSSSVGICALCLKDRLLNLVCSDCGEQRLSSCSCSDQITSHRNSSASAAAEVGSVGRISFLIENENQGGNNTIFSQLNSSSKPSKSSRSKTDDVFLLKRSSSTTVEIKKKTGFWRIGKLFSKKREKGTNGGKNICERSSSVGGFEEKTDLWVVDYMGVSRSRSLCSFRGGGFFGSEDGTFSGARSSISAARSSISAARNSGVNAGGGGLGFDADRKSGFSEAEPRKSGFDSDQTEKVESCFNGGHNNNNTRRVFSLKESNFSSTMDDDSRFIDLKFDLASSDLNSGLVGQDQYSNEIGGFRVGERGIKRSRKSFKSWRWIFGHNYYLHSKKKEDDQQEIVVSNHA
ncbi:uncharacterized protein LOC126671440 [Mercurialis annua]|uniref:uncharacterized protein LOC126671440 n=1 Tax=Mercurialis annua TaxID=3986 RepID=UPI00215F4ADE|nr:uncharacterized protein LOC126671440 [Mercurialis annua]